MKFIDCFRIRPQHGFVTHEGTWLRAAASAGIVSAALALQACGGGGGTASDASDPTDIPINASDVSPSGAGSGPATAGSATGTSSSNQYTPDQANWATFASKPVNAGNTGHDPDGVFWISRATWDAAKWNGTPYNPSTLTKAQLAAAICPTGDTVRGLREVFYANPPFADNTNPTKAEVDEWHRIAINHVRALVGYTTTDRLVQKDYCMSARATWGDERKFTKIWDTKYPGTLGSAAGPCVGPNNVLSSNAHCGASFVPDADDQVPYLPVGHLPCTAAAGAEGVFPAPKSNIPWSIKWSRAFCSTLGTEGFWGGHTGPWFHREKFGFSFWDTGSIAVLRAKWTGTLKDSLYCDPTNPACVP
jgi:hypothetical protein